MAEHSILDVLLALGGLGGFAALIMALIARRKAHSEIRVNEGEAEKKEAEATNIITQAASQVAVLLRAQIMDLQKGNKALQEEICALKKVQAQHERKIAELQSIADRYDELLSGAHTLCTQVIELNETPRYTPPERRK